jgi:hypothetical protein
MSTLANQINRDNTGTLLPIDYSLGNLVQPMVPPRVYRRKWSKPINIRKVSRRFLLWEPQLLCSRGQGKDTTYLPYTVA